MKKLVAMVVLATFLLAATVPMAEAGGGAALGLAAFAAFTSLLAFPFWAYGYGYPAPVYPYPAPAYYAAPAVTYAAPAVTYAAPPAPAVQREVVYPHGRHVLYGDGVQTAYQWVWVPNAPPPPPPPAGTPPAPPPTR